METFHYRYDGNGNQVYREWEKLSPKETKSGRVGFVQNVHEEDIATLDLREYREGCNSKLFETIMLTFIMTVLLVICFLLWSYMLRKCIYHFAFYGMSKTRKKKILKECSVKERILMLHVLKYNSPKMTRWCLACYYIFSICAILIIFVEILYLFLPPDLIQYLSPFLFISFFLCLFSPFVKPK